MRMSDWSSDVCSSERRDHLVEEPGRHLRGVALGDLGGQVVAVDCEAHEREGRRRVRVDAGAEAAEGPRAAHRDLGGPQHSTTGGRLHEIGSASSRKRVLRVVYISVGDVPSKKK